MNNVRLKVKVRLRTVLADIAKEANPGGRPSDLIRMSRLDRTVAEAVRTRYRLWVSTAFIGCRIEFGRQNVYIHLPNRYPASNVPIVEPLAPIHIECFHPRGDQSF